jgi:hypothetical protein
MVRGTQVDAVVAVAETDAEPWAAAASDGLVALLEALTARGLAAAPDVVACARIETGLRAVLRGGGVVVLPDGTRLGAQGRMPWLDVDLDLTPEEVGQVVLEWPAPVRSRGWQRPARLRRDTQEPSRSTRSGSARSRCRTRRSTRPPRSGPARAGPSSSTARWPRAGGALRAR